MLPTPAMKPSRPQLSRYGWRPADPARQPVLFINPRSGDGKAARAGVAERARAKGIEAVILAPGQNLAALAREAAAAAADVLGMAGGDGSLAVVAAAAAAHGIPFVCVEALHAHPDLHVYLLVTLASPLALPGAGKAPS
jgi:Diacylglycerol kinase catalytic domain